MSQQADTKEKRTLRPPVVAIMGHVDHGKSSLLDYIRKTNVVETESGGITQHLSAYEIEYALPGGLPRRITFIDTPGHAAFSHMRHRGAAVADMAILLVSGEEGVKAQTIEAIKTLKEHAVPFVVAISKIDRPNVSVEKIKNGLLEAEVYVEGYGGDVPAVPVSSKSGEGIEELLETLLLLADMQEFTGNPEKDAEGFVIEAHLDEKRGITATLIIKNGTLHQGEYVVVGDSFAGTRIMEDFKGDVVKEISFSSPVRIVGFSKIPEVGGIFATVDSKREAEEYVRSVSKKIAKTPERVIGEDEIVTVIPIIIKADTFGTAEAIEHEIKKLSTDDVWMKVVKKGVGVINEDDVKIALCDTGTIIVGFNVSVDRVAKDVDGADGITIKTFSIIYKLTEWLEEERAKRKHKKKVEVMVGKLRVLKYFSSMKNRHLVGGRVEEGELQKGCRVCIVRSGERVGTGTIESLQKAKADIARAESGDECGLFVKTDLSPLPGDVFEYVREDEV